MSVDGCFYIKFIVSHQILSKILFSRQKLFGSLAVSKMSLGSQQVYIVLKVVRWTVAVSEQLNAMILIMRCNDIIIVR